MILHEFRDQFFYLASGYAEDVTVAGNISRIKQILDKPITSVQEALDALAEIEKVLGAGPHEFTHQIKQLIGHESHRLADVDAVAKRALPPIPETHLEALEGMQAILPRTAQLPGVPICDAETLMTCDHAYRAHVYPNFSQSKAFTEDEVNRSFELVKDKLKDKPKEVLSKVEEDRQEFLCLIKDLNEERNSTLFLDEMIDQYFAFETSDMVEAIKNLIVIARCVNGKEIPAEYFDAKKCPPHFVVWRQLMVQDKASIREIFSLFPTMLPTMVIDVALLLCAILKGRTSVAHRMARDVWEGYDQTQPYYSLLLSLAPFMTHIQGKDSEIQQSFAECPQDVRFFFQDRFEVDFGKFIDLREDIAKFLAEGFSFKALEEIAAANAFSSLSVTTKKRILHEIISIHKEFKAHGYDNETAEKVIRSAPNQLRLLAHFVTLPDEQVRIFKETMGKQPSWENNPLLAQYLLKGSSLAFFQKVHRHIGLLPDCFFDKEVQELFLKKTDDEVKVFFTRFKCVFQFLVNAPQGSIAKILVREKEADLFFKHISTSSQQVDSQSREKGNEQAAKNFLHLYADVPIKDQDVGKYFSSIARALSIEERQLLLKDLSKDQFTVQYLAESLNIFGDIVSTVPLHSVATEPLIRFITVMPQTKAISWLEEQIETKKGKKHRVETLSSEQKMRILLAIPRPNMGLLPSQEWMDKLGVTKENVEKEFQRLSQSSTEAIQEMTLGKDTNDPFDFILGSFTSANGKTPIAVLNLLLAAKEENVACGARRFLTWGNASPIGDLASAQDGSPMIVRRNGEIMPLFQRGLLHDFAFSAPTVRLRRELYAICHEDKELENELQRSLDLRTEPDNHRLKELYYEIMRMSQFIEASYPTLSMSQYEAMSTYHLFSCSEQNLHAIKDVESFPLRLQKIQDMMEQVGRSPYFNEEKTFNQLVSGIFLVLMRSSDVKINVENYAHLYASMFISILFLGRNARIVEKENAVDVALSPWVRFHLQELSSASLQRLEKDNPGFSDRDLLELSAEYPTHTLSPITPSITMPPKIFKELVAKLQKLSDQEFYALCSACSTLFEISEDDAERMYLKDYLQMWNKACAQTQLTFSFTELENQLIGSKIAVKYMGALKPPEPLVPGLNIVFKKAGVLDYTSEVPGFLASEGNYASALCTYMKPLDTRLHDGNCGVNALLLALEGNALNDLSTCSLDDLYARVAHFRHKLVEYAKVPENKKWLESRCGEEAVTEFITKFDFIGNRRQPPEWMKDVALACAANVYKRKIIVYKSPQTASGLVGEKTLKEREAFWIGAEGEIETDYSYDSKEGAEDPPVYLMNWQEMHFCPLFRKKN